jgi:xylulose-5-phosphate/fructose-6-phosphate phosphoketolase
MATRSPTPPCWRASPRQELVSLMRGYGWEPIFVEGSDPMLMHRTMAAAMDQAVGRILEIRRERGKR